MVLQSDISHWQLVYNRNTTSKGKSNALTKKTSWELSKTTMDTAATSSAACEAGEDEAVLVIRPSHSRHTRPIWECYNYYTTATNILQCLAWVAWHSAMKPRKSAILGRSNIARHGWILITFAHEQGRKSFDFVVYHLSLPYTWTPLYLDRKAANAWMGHSQILCKLPTHELATHRFCA